MMTIAMIDKHPILRSGLGCFLKEHFKEVTILESDSIMTFQEMYPEKKPDLTILGISQNSSASNLSFMNHLKARLHKDAVIIYDENPDLRIVSDYLKVGATGFLSKQSDLTELVDCIREVMDGRRYISMEILNMVLNDTPAKKTVVSKANNLLTPRENEIAKYLILGMKTTSIAQSLGKHVSTISTIKNNIFKKLKVDNILKLRDTLELNQTY